QPPVQRAAVRRQPGGTKRRRRAFGARAQLVSCGEPLVVGAHPHVAALEAGRDLPEAAGRADPGRAAEIVLAQLRLPGVLLFVETSQPELLGRRIEAWVLPRQRASGP